MPSTEVGTIWWNELISANPEQSRNFYAAVVGWKPRIVAQDDETRAPRPGESEYTYFSKAGTDTAGLSNYDATDPFAPKPGWITYIQVSDVDIAVTEALRMGGKVLKAPFTAEKFGRMAIVQDLDGNSVGLYAKLAQLAPTQPSRTLSPP